MKISLSFWHGMRAAASAGLILCLASACKPSAPPSGPPKTVTAAATKPVASASANVSAEYVSTFEQLMPPKGKDPFFPNSRRRDPVAPLIRAPNSPLPEAVVTLKGIVGGIQHRLAVINNAILEVGEAGSVKVPGGHVQVRCMEIGEDYAVVKVDGEIQTKRLQLNRKGL
jgi:hypothetical protein